VPLVQRINPSSSGRSRRIWAAVEIAAWGIGFALLADWGAWYVEGVTGRREALERFAVLQAAAQNQTPTTDVSLWSSERISAWRSALKVPSPAPLAVLRIPRIGLEVPVFEGTGEVVLNQGVGHIEETAAPGSHGNSGIAGHRDGFFRGLKDVDTGDTIELETLQGKERYRVERIWIVNPEDVSVLDATPHRAVTLVTCYPFYFVGPAPQRYIVRAVRDTPDSWRGSASDRRQRDGAEGVRQ
jgi:sortase A